MEPEAVEVHFDFEQKWRNYLARQQQEQSKAHSDMVKRGMKRKLEAGGTTGVAALGYANKRIGSNSWVEIDPVMGPLVKEVFELAATGRYSIRDLIMLTADQGLRSRHKNILSPSAFAALLSNPYYLSKLRVNEKWVTGLHTPLVTHELFSQVQCHLAKRRKNWSSWHISKTD